MTNDEIKRAVESMRGRARRVGPQHALWDLIFDCEALLNGERTLLKRADIEAMVRQELGDGQSTRRDRTVS